MQDPTGFFQVKLLATSQSCQPAAKADLFDGFEWLHLTLCPTHQWEFGLGKDSTEEAGRLDIYSWAICSHTCWTWNWTSGCRIFFTSSIMNFLVALGPLFAMLFSVWVWWAEISACQTAILYQTPPRKWQSWLECSYSFLNTWCPKSSLIHKQLYYVFLAHPIYKFVTQLCKQSDRESEKPKRKIDFSENLTVMDRTPFMESWVVFQYLFREAHLRLFWGGGFYI